VHALAGQISADVVHGGFIVDDDFNLLRRLLIEKPLATQYRVGAWFAFAIENYGHEWVLLFFHDD
jgi:hypothetical protein